MIGTGLRRRAYTLVEMVVSLGVLSLIMGSLASIMVLMSRALPASDDPATSVVAAERFAAQFASDIETATSFSVLTETEVSFSVPDRDADGFEEKLSYSWAGGDNPVLRTLNSGASEELLESVGDLSFEFDGVSGGAGGETQFRDAASADLALPLTDDQTMYAARVVPTLPGDVQSWNLERVEVVLRKAAGATGDVAVMVFDDKSGQVSASMLAREQVRANAIGTSRAAVSVALDVSPFAANEACWIVVTRPSGSGTIELGGSSSKGSTSTKGSANGGSSWGDLSFDLCIDAFGSADSKSGSVERVVLTVVPLAGNATTIRTAVEVLNRPELGG